jgi:hypothetical protein
MMPHGFGAIAPAFVNRPLLALHEVKGDADRFPESEELI